MPTKTPAQASDTQTLRQQADAAAAQAAEAQALAMASEDAEHARALEAQAERDRATVESFDRAALTRAVTEARDAYEAAVRDLPVTQALANLLHAGNLERWAFFDVTAARGRLGMPTDGTQPGSMVNPSVLDTIDALAQSIAQAQTDAHRAEMEG